MEFKSFEEALHVCMAASDGSDEQEAALAYCMENAPPELKEKIRQKLAEFHRKHDHKDDGSCGCGCH